MLSCLNNVESFEESKNILKNLNLVVKEYSDLGLYLVKYNKNNKDIVFNEDIMKCRGLILDYKNNIVCAPPFKSIDPSSLLSLSEEEQNKIIYEDFIDGTMINIFYYNGWHISTRSCLGANCRWYSKKNFSELFEDCKDFDIENLNSEYCYNFVLKHPDNRIVTSYDISSLVLVGAYKIQNNVINFLELNNVQLELKEKNINIDIPKNYTFNSLTEAFNYVCTLPYDNQGLVLKYNNYRSKFINPHYNYVRTLRGNNNNPKYLFFELRKSNLTNEFLNYYPEYQEQFDTYLQELYSMTQNLFNFYQEYRVKKNIEYDDIDYEYRPLVYKLHGIYLNSKVPISFAKVKHFVNNMDTPQLLFTLNYKKNNEESNTEQNQESNTESNTEETLESNTEQNQESNTEETSS